jgi:hypothetical protein
MPCAKQLLLPLLDKCRPVLDVLFDADDGVRDGVASQFDDIYDSCLSIDAPAALQALADLQTTGQCSDAQLDGVGETNVLGAGEKCQLCGGRNQLQDAKLSCDLQNFQTGAESVSSSCCDDGASCSAGMPTTCDAKCALTFTPFYDRCSAVLATQVDPATMSSYSNLYNTCSTGLPVEPLLRAAATCAALEPPVHTDDASPSTSPAWHLGSEGDQCSDVCSGVGLDCKDGDWGLHDEATEATFRAAFEASGHKPDGLDACGAGIAQASWPAHPMIDGGYCYYWPFTSSMCTASFVPGRRLCLCV